eukprot:1352856-Pyramimonas_sp.AAC.2
MEKEGSWRTDRRLGHGNMEVGLGQICEGALNLPNGQGIVEPGPSLSPQHCGSRVSLSFSLPRPPAFSCAAPWVAAKCAIVATFVGFWEAQRSGVVNRPSRDLAAPWVAAKCELSGYVSDLIFFVLRAGWTQAAHPILRDPRLALPSAALRRARDCEKAQA